MSTLQQIAQTNPEWDLEMFVDIANDLLSQFLPPAETTRNRSSEAINARLVRYYTTQGGLDRPLRQGREARYIYRHLLQLLVVRRLLAQGYSMAAIKPITVEKDNSALEALLQGGVQLTVEAANPALAFLQSVQARTQPVSASAASALADPVQSPPLPSAPAANRRLAAPDASQATAKSAGEVSHWQRVEVLPGLEVQVRDDFVPPSTPQEQENLLQLIAQQLKPLFHARRSSP
ncbi:MAG: MerR family transcriptional regulator [Leptolyngbya sp. SIO1D8]|nr:MerR family transcriptional regulator [Leptolyngbya sp. SIO1D8]